MALPEGYNVYPCGVCGDIQWNVVVGHFDEQLAMACCGCDNIVHVSADSSGGFNLNEE